MIDTAHQLLLEAAEQFRFYERNHRAKLDDPISTNKREETIAKAEANASLASKIELYLTSPEASGQPDIYKADTARSVAAALDLPPVVRETLRSRDPMAMVFGFHELFEAPVYQPFLACADNTFSHMDDARVAVRVGFVAEELMELLYDGLGVKVELVLHDPSGVGYLDHNAETLTRGIQGTGIRNGVEVIDALGDIVYVCYGFALELGYDLSAVVREIHASNLTKVGIGGVPITNGVTPGYRASYALETNTDNPAMSEPEAGYDPNKPIGKVLKGAHYVEPQIALTLDIDA